MTKHTHIKGRRSTKRLHVKRALFLAITAVFALNIYLASAPWVTQAVAADAHHYTLVYSHDIVGDLKAAAHDGGIGSTDTGGVLKKTTLLTQGGRLGTQVLTLDPKLSDKNDRPTYGLTYYCTPKGGTLSGADTTPDKFTLSTTKPSNDQIYATILMRVALADNGNWGSVVSAPNGIKTYVGVAGGGNDFGNLHVPGITNNDANDPTFSVPDRDIPLFSRGDSDGIGTTLLTQGLSEDASFAGNQATMVQNCMPHPNGNQGNDTSIYDKLSKSDKDAWSAALKTAGLGDDALAVADNGGSVDNGQTSPECESGGDPLNWVLCPIFNAVAGISDWLFSSVVEPLLRTTPISVNPDDCKNGDGDCTYQIWSGFRVYGNIFLVIALLVIVFGQSIGGGLIDAYTAKKVLPRLLIAVILINLSIYIVALLVDITNVVGGSIGSLMTQPLKDAGAFNITPSGVQAGTIQGVSLAGGVAFFATFAISKLVLVSALTQFLSFAALFIIMPIFLGMLMAFITLVLRQGIILALVLVSPVAFALYCLPNTEKYFRKWWEWLSQALLVYPIVIVFFAVADILSVTVMNSGGKDNPLSAIISFTLQFLPLIFIPYAFRLAGGAVARAHEVLSGASKRSQEAIKGNANDPNSLRNRVKGNAGANFTRARAQRFRDWNANTPDDAGRFRRATGGLRRGTGRVGSLMTAGAIESEALLTQKAKQRIGSIKDNGDDSIINARASFIDTDGRRKTLDGKNVSAMEWAAAQRLHPTLGEMQAVAEYRAGKVTSTEQANNFLRNYGMMAQQQGLSVQEANGAYTGFSFGKQDQFGHMKYGTYNQNPQTGAFEYQAVGDTASFQASSGDFNDSRAANMVQEHYSNKSAYAEAAQHAQFHNAMADVKLGYLNRAQAYHDRVAAGDHTPQTAEEAFAFEKVKQITEMERNNQYQSPPIPGQDDGGGQPQQVMPGQQSDPNKLNGASAGTQAAYSRSVQLSTDPRYAETMAAVHADLLDGRTYESVHSPAPTDNHGDRYQP